MKKWIHESDLTHLESLKRRRMILQAEVNKLTEEIEAIESELNKGKSYVYKRTPYSMEPKFGYYRRSP